LLNWILLGMAALLGVGYLCRRPLGRLIVRWLKFDQFPSIPPGCG